MKKTCIISLGWLGSSFYDELEKLGNPVLGTFHNKSKNKLFELRYDFNKDAIPPEILVCDIIIINLPPTILNTTQALEKFLKQVSDKRIIFISSISIFGNQGIVNEQSSPLPDTERGQYNLSLEKVVQTYAQNYVIIRAAGLYGGDRHPGKYLAGKVDVKSPNAPVNLISRTDLIDIIQKVLLSSEIKLIHAVNKHHPSKQNFYQNYCKRNNLDLPHFSQDDQQQSPNKIIETSYPLFLINSALEGI